MGNACNYIGVLMHDEREEAHQHIVLSLGSLIAQAPTAMALPVWGILLARVSEVSTAKNTGEVGLRSAE